MQSRQDNSHGNETPLARESTESVCSCYEHPDPQKLLTRSIPAGQKENKHHKSNIIMTFA